MLDDPCGTSLVECQGHLCAGRCHGVEGSARASSIRQRAGVRRERPAQKWLADAGAKTLYIEPGSPWENGYCESFNSKLRDEFLNPEIFYSMKELRVLAERWRVHYNTVRPHSSLGYKPPAPEAWLTSTTWQHGEPVASLPAPRAATPCIDLNSDVVALH
jgi:hypothetical protein